MTLSSATMKTIKHGEYEYLSIIAASEYAQTEMSIIGRYIDDGKLKLHSIEVDGETQRLIRLDELEIVHGTLKKDGEEYLTAKAAAAYAGLTKDTISHHLYKSGRLTRSPQLHHGEIRSMIAKSELDELKKKARSGRPRGITLRKDAPEKYVDLERDNRYLPYSYSLLRDENLSPVWQLLCHQHGVKVGRPTKRDAVCHIAYPWEWCPECKKDYEALPAAEQTAPENPCDRYIPDDWKQ